MRLDDLDEVVGQNFKDNVEDEEDGQGCCELVALEMERLLDPVDLGVGDVHSVEEGKEVEETERWNDAHVDFPHEFLLVDAMFLGQPVDLGFLLLDGEFEVCDGVVAENVGGDNILEFLLGGLSIAALVKACSVVGHFLGPDSDSIGCKSGSTTFCCECRAVGREE